MPFGLAPVWHFGNAPRALLKGRFPHPIRRYIIRGWCSRAGDATARASRSQCFWDFWFTLACLNAGPPEAKIEDRPSEKVVDKQTDKKRADLVALLDDQLARIGAFEEYALQRENLAVDAEARSFSLPPGDATDKLLRYEAHLDRQLYRAMDQLERLQRQRRGETVPPPLNINLGKRA